MTSLAYKLNAPGSAGTTQAEPTVRPRALVTAKPETRADTHRIPLFSLVGFTAICVLIVMILVSHIRLDQANLQKAQLASQLDTLQQDYTNLNSQYDQMFDLDAIKNELTLDGSMVQISSDQQIYMDLSRPDSAVAFEDPSEKNPSALSSLISSASDYIW